MSKKTVEELPFVVEEWSNGFKEPQGTLARAIAADIAIAAFEGETSSQSDGALGYACVPSTGQRPAEEAHHATLNDGLPSVLDVWFQLME